MARSKLRSAQHRLTRPARRTALPVLKGSGRGLRVRFGESALGRVIGRGEPAVERKLLEIVRPGDVVFDIGANIGWYTLLAGRRVGAAGRVVAFEPDLENAALVQRNAASNRLANVTVIAAAVTDQDGWATFLNRGSLEGRLGGEEDGGQDTSNGARAQRVRGTVPVPVVSLDTWIEQAQQPPPRLIKIDIEGGEIGALRGMEQTLRSAGPTLIIELHGTREAVLDQLDSYGYEHATIERDVPTREAPWWAHVLAWPRATG